MLERIRNFCEKRGFEVCSRLGDKIGIQHRVIRMYFIYTSFITLGSPLIVYLVLAFWIRIKDYVQESKSSVFDI